MPQQNSINNRTSQLTVDPGASGDSFVQFDINSTGEFRIGVDDTDDSYRISQGSALGTNDTFVMTSAGERTMPLQPSFLAYKSSSSTNVTGDGTQYTVAADTEIWDQGGDYNSGTYTFTAPVTGRYLFHAGVYFTSVGSGYVNVYFYTSNRFVNTYVVNNGAAISGQVALNSNFLVDMDASDVATFRVTGVGTTKTMGVLGGAGTGLSTWWAGSLLI